MQMLLNLKETLLVQHETTFFLFIKSRLHSWKATTLLTLVLRMLIPIFAHKYGPVPRGDVWDGDKSHLARVSAVAKFLRRRQLLRERQAHGGAQL